MPSPFPGMDPYLEHPAIFPDLHDRMIVYVSGYLQPRLPVPYYSVVGSRVWVEPSQRPIGPDARVMRSNGQGRVPESNGGGVATLTRAKPVIVKIIEEEMRETLVEIRSRLDDHERLVASIEILSPTNKAKGPGRDSYQKKQREVLASQVHLIEIDLLRGGEHTIAVPHEIAWAEAGPFDYLASVHPFDGAGEYQLYPILLQEKLPTIQIPLLPGDGSVDLDMQVVTDRAYDEGPYARQIHYAETTTFPPLSADQMEWANRILREKGIIKAS
ncbi:MAG: DUF4058 family protein [Planctomycetes bacterium]|nr:DUF4058 family protein [Planctomycetota bacterium]